MVKVNRVCVFAVVKLSSEDCGSKGIGDDSSLGRKFGITAVFGQLWNRYERVSELIILEFVANRGCGGQFRNVQFIGGDGLNALICGAFYEYTVGGCLFIFPFVTVGEEVACGAGVQDSVAGNAGSDGGSAGNAAGSAGVGRKVESYFLFGLFSRER